MAMNMIGINSAAAQEAQMQAPIGKKEDAAFVHVLLIKKFDVFANPASNMYALLIANNN